MRKFFNTFLVLGMLVFASEAFAQSRMVSGTISDDSGDPVAGATVRATGTDAAVISSLDGSYLIQVPDGAETLTVSFVGMETQTATINGDTVDFTMATDANMLDGVVVTALGVTRDEKSIGYGVQEVSGETLDQARETNIVNALQGQVAGVQIQGSPSTLGGSSRVTIRGSNSFTGNNQPLFVIDGVPVDNSGLSGSSQERGFGGATAYDYGNPISDLDPSSIESLSVLKGAAATALYGSRGANGVILVTTKSGTRSKGLGIEVNSSFTADEVANLIPHQQEYGGGSINGGTSHGFFELTQDGTNYLYPAYGKDGSWGPKYDPNLLVRHWDSWDPNSANYKEVRAWDAPANGYEKFFDTGITAINGISLSGGNDLGNFRLGYTNSDQKGTIPGGELKRNALSFKSGYNLSDKIKVGFTGNYTRTDTDSRNITGYNNGNPMQAFTQWWQTQLDVERLKAQQSNSIGDQYTWNANGPETSGGAFTGYNFDPVFFDNPFWVRNNYLQEDFRNRFVGNANASVQLMKGLTLSGQFGTDFYNFSAREGIPTTSVETSYYEELERNYQENNLEARLNYETQFSDRFSLNAFFGGNRMRRNRENLNTNSVGGLSLEGLYNVSNSVDPAVTNTYLEDRGINSLFGSFSIGFDEWLYLDASARNDWSSTLPAEDNSYFYPAVSLSAALTELDAFSNIGVLSYAKVRASFAQAGNDAGAFSLFPVFANSGPNFGSFPRYGVPNALPNSQLVNELTEEMEVGLDLRFLNDRFGVSASYFDRSTTEQIFAVPTSAATGYTSRVLNAGEMRNWGLEMAINATPIQTDDFSWNLNVNLFQQNNEVVELDPTVTNIGQGGTWAADLRVAEGLPYMALFGQDYMYHENGQRLVDANGAYMFTDNRVFLGSAIADWTGGVNTAFNYKNFSLSSLFDFQEGGVIHSTSLQWAKYSGMHPETVSFNGESDTRANGMVLPGVQADGSPNTTRIDPQTYYQTFWRRAAPNVYDASFVKWREARLNYKFPSKIFQNTAFRNASVGLFGRNLAIISSDVPFIDPQIVTGSGNRQGLENAQVPSTRSMGLNLQFGF